MCIWLLYIHTRQGSVCCRGIVRCRVCCTVCVSGFIYTHTHKNILPTFPRLGRVAVHVAVRVAAYVAECVAFSHDLPSFRECNTFSNTHCNTRCNTQLQHTVATHSCNTHRNTYCNTQLHTLQLQHNLKRIMQHTLQHTP